VTSVDHAELPSAWADGIPGLRALGDVAAVVDAELHKVVRDPVEIFTRAAQPLLWLLVFGQVITRTRAIATGPISYIDYLTPGVLAQSALFAAIFYGIAVIWERDLGIAHKLLVSPASRVSLILGKAVTAGIRSTVQAVIIYVAAFAIGVHVRTDPAAILGVIVVVMLGSALFATFSLTIACIVRSRERFMGIGQLMTMPVFFASSAVYPIALMPPWLQTVASVNPLTYMVDAARGLMIVGGTAEHGLPLDMAVLVGVTAMFVLISARLYPRLAQ
jgi:ABC-2 type transport system permease protein